MGDRAFDTEASSHPMGHAHSTAVPDVIAGALRGAALLFLALGLGPRPGHATMPSRSGPPPAAVTAAFEAGLFRVPDHAPLATSAARPLWRVPVILVAFSDAPLTFSSADFARTIFDTTGAVPTGALYDYYQWVSRGRLRVVAEVVGTLTLPNPRTFYAASAHGLSPVGTPSNAYGALREALRMHERNVDWTRYDLDQDGFVDMVWMVHAGFGGEWSRDPDDFWSITSRTTQWSGGEAFITHSVLPGTTDHPIRIERFSVLPERSFARPGSISEIGVYCHEFGHALGLPDLYDTSVRGGAANVGPGNWSLMATGSYGANGVSPENPAHLGAWPMQFLGWTVTVRPTRDTTVTLAPIARGGPVIELWAQGESSAEHFLIENRQSDRFDATLPLEGLIAYHVDEAIMGAGLASNRVNSGPVPGLQILEGDGDFDLARGVNGGDGGDPLPGAHNRTDLDDDTVPGFRTFRGGLTGVALQAIRQDGDNMVFELRVRPAGWSGFDRLETEDLAPLASYGPAHRSGVGRDGEAHIARSEIRGGVPQIVVRSEHDRFAVGAQVSHSTRAAVDPSLALLPGGDLAVVWNDLRAGRGRIFYRARVRGGWTSERELVAMPGECRNPALVADRRGVLHLVFQHVVRDTPEVWFMRFTYLSPFGQPRRMSDPGELPGSPALTVGHDGSTSVFWTDISRFPGRLWMRRFHPDSGLAPRMGVAPSGLQNRVAVNAITDKDGTMHVLWHVSGPGGQELHYQRRFANGPPAPFDTTLEVRGSSLFNPTLETDPSGGIHLLYETIQNGQALVRYKHWEPGRGWDQLSLAVNGDRSGSGSVPALFARRPDRVDVLFVSYDDGAPALILRTRDPHAGSLAVTPGVTRGVGTLTVGPNPLRAGGTLALRYRGPRTPAVELFDLAGRRLVAIPLAQDGELQRADAGPELVRLPPGVYFLRPRGPQQPAVRLVMLR